MSRRFEFYHPHQIIRKRKITVAFLIFILSLSFLCACEDSSNSPEPTEIETTEATDTKVMTFSEAKEEVDKITNDMDLDNKDIIRSHKKVEINSYYGVYYG